ncbi:MAG TPA: dihydropteroate synthase [Bacteroidota bacterium]|nr:dihydropteroate synthase [Bacteroidota bacterium]
MSVSGLTIIAESINDSVPSTHAMFEENNIDGIVGLAITQAAKGGAYVDVNVGSRSPAFMAELVRRIQEQCSQPLSIDTPDPAIAAAGLAAYDPARAGNRKPILNSISEARLEMFDIYQGQPFIPILLVTEGLNSSGSMVMNKSAEQIHDTARSMVGHARKRVRGITNDQIILDPGIMPIGSDSKGDLRRLINAMTLIHADKDLAGINMSVGLSNFTNMLPSRKADGSPVKSPLESAFLTIAMPLGLNMIIGSVSRKYSLLPDDDPAMQCVRDVMELEGVDAIMRVMKFFS